MNGSIKGSWRVTKFLWKAFCEGFWHGMKRTPAFYFEPVTISWRWLKRGARALGRGAVWLARAGWRPKTH